MELLKTGAYLVNGTEIIEDTPEAQARLQAVAGPDAPSKEEAAKGTIAYGILEAHNTSDNMEKLKIRFDKLTSHDITYVGIIQTARASGLEKFPMPYVLTNCHNSLCAVGGTINEDDHMFGLTCAKKYGGIYVPPHQAVIHQFAREMLACGGAMILGSDSHTRYGALGTMAMGEGGPELVKQLLNQTYDINMPGVIGIYMTGEPIKGVGPQDVALAIIGAVFQNGYVNNKVMEFVGPGVEKLSADFRIGVDVMTTETTCLSSIWKTDDVIKDFYDIHGRVEDYKELNPAKVAYYDGMVKIDLSKIRPMIAMPFHPSNTYTIEDMNKNLMDVLHDCEQKALVSLDGQVDFKLTDKVRDGKLYVEQGIIAGCAGGGFENLCAAADIIKGKSIGADEFTLSVYPASTPIYMELVKNGAAAALMESGAIVKTAFCGPCFGAGDTPSNNSLSIRHSTRNFPNREGSKLQNGQIASVALMDARSIAATAANKGYLTPATDLDVEYTGRKYHLSTYMTAYDRQKVLQAIREELKSLDEDFPDGNIPEERRITIISTSLIEAGVDLDVYTVFRELNGLDSILQSGGRCNREGKRDKGEVFVFEFENEAQNDKMNITQRLLAEYKDISQPECIEEYYEEVFFLKQENIQKNTMHIKCRSFENLPFQTYAEQFELIPDRTCSIVVPRDEKSRKLVDTLRYTKIENEKELQKYTCTVTKKELDELIKQHVADDFGTGIYCLTNEDYYDENLGILLEAQDYFL